MQQMGAGGRGQRPQQRSSDWPSVPESTTHSVPQVSSNSLRVSIGSQEFELLSGLDKSLAGTADPEGRGLFVSRGRKEQSEHPSHCSSCSRLVAAPAQSAGGWGQAWQRCHRHTSGTQFVLLELAEGGQHASLVDGSMRATLRGADERKRTQRARAKGKGPGPDSNLVAHVQSGDSSTVAGGMERMMFVGTGDDPFGHCGAVSRRLRPSAPSTSHRASACLRTSTTSVWCTWDAFYQADPDGIARAWRRYTAWGRRHACSSSTMAGKLSSRTARTRSARSRAALSRCRETSEEANASAPRGHRRQPDGHGGRPVSRSRRRGHRHERGAHLAGARQRGAQSNLRRFFAEKTEFLNGWAPSRPTAS